MEPQRERGFLLLFFDYSYGAECSIQTPLTDPFHVPTKLTRNFSAKSNASAM